MADYSTIASGASATEQATEQAAEQAINDQYAVIFAGFGATLDAVVAQQGQALDASMDQADALQSASNAAADQIYSSTGQAALAQQEADDQTADDVYSNAETAAENAFNSINTSATNSLNAALAAHQNTFDTTTTALQTTHDSNIAAAMAAADATIAADQAAFDATKASLDSVLQNTSDILGDATNEVIENNWVSPGMYGSVDSDPGFQSAMSTAVANYNAQVAALVATHDQAYADADAALQTKIDNATNQQSIANQNAANAYDVATTVAYNQYTTDWTTAENAEASAFADHLLTYLQSVNAADAQYASEVQQAQAVLAAATAAATATYNTGAQNAQNGYNSWYATRSATYNTDVQNRQNQLHSADQLAESQYATAIAGFAAINAAADQQAETDYNNAVAGLTTIQYAADAVAWQDYDAIVTPAGIAEQNAEDNYNMTVMQIYMDSMMLGLPPDQGALDAALDAIETARQGFSNTLAGAGVALNATVNQDAVDFYAGEETAWKAEQVAIASADGDYLIAEAGAKKTVVDKEAHNEADCDADLATLSAAYQNEVAQHQADLQTAIAALAKTRDDAIDDAEGVDQDTENDSWQTDQDKIADASTKEAKDDTDSVGGFQHVVAGLWDTVVIASTAAEQQMINAEAAAQKVATDAINDAGGQNTLDHAAADVAFSDGEAADALQYYTAMIDAWAATLVGFAPNDPAVAAVAAAVSNYALSMAGLAMSQAVQLAGAQQQQIGLDVEAVLSAAHTASAEDQSLANGVAAAAVQRTDDDAGSQVTFAGIVTDAAVTASKTEADAAGIALKTVISDSVVAAHKIVAATVLQTHGYLTNGMTWVTTVAPLAVAAQVAENNAAAAEVGQVDEAGADEVEEKTAAAVAQVGTDVPAAEAAVGKAADADKTLVGKMAQAEADDSDAEAEAEAAAVAALPKITFIETPLGPIWQPSGFGNPKNNVGIWGRHVSDLGPLDNPMILEPVSKPK